MEVNSFKKALLAKDHQRREFERILNEQNLESAKARRNWRIFFFLCLAGVGYHFKDSIRLPRLSEKKADSVSMLEILKLASKQMGDSQKTMPGTKTEMKKKPKGPPKEAYAQGTNKYAEELAKLQKQGKTKKQNSNYKNPNAKQDEMAKSAQKTKSTAKKNYRIASLAEAAKVAEDPRSHAVNSAMYRNVSNNVPTRLIDHRRELTK